MGCRFVELLAAITGNSSNREDLKLLRDRINTLERLFLAREGVTRKEDHLPARFHNDSLSKGRTKGRVVRRKDLEKMLDENYASC